MLAELEISTHTPLAGRDLPPGCRFQNRIRFLLTRPSRGATAALQFPEWLPEFLLTRPSRGATIGWLDTHPKNRISTHTPLAGRDCGNSYHDSLWCISTHTPLAGRDSIVLGKICEMADFYSHAPRGARLMYLNPSVPACPFLLTRPSRGATVPRLILYLSVQISTHTPLAGRDSEPQYHQQTMVLDFYSHAPRGARLVAGSICCSFFPISTHTPLAGRDGFTSCIRRKGSKFLLTRPSRGATSGRLCGLSLYSDFYSHAPRGARPHPFLNLFITAYFYSHAPRGARPLHLACNSESFPTYRGADFFIIKSARFCRFIRYLMPLFQANLPGFLHHQLFPYHFIHAGIRNIK